MTEPVTTGPDDAPAGPTRRRVLVTSGVVAAAAAVTTACGSGGRFGGAASPAGPATVKTTDVPVGGGVVLQDQQVVITQPAAGTFKAFSAVCTHEGCLVSGVANNVITCPCHMGEFSATDGSVQGGPPPAPLVSARITVSGTTITVT